MSDFLGNFTNDNYKKTLDEKAKSKTDNSESVMEDSKETTNVPTSSPVKRKRKRKIKHANLPSDVIPDLGFDDPDLIDEEYEGNVTDTEIMEDSVSFIEEAVKIDETDNDHEIEIDPDYQKKQRNKKLVLIGGAVITCLVFYFIYYQMSRVKMPSFTDKSVTDVRKWAKDNKMDPSYETAYSLDKETSDVLKQSIKAGKNVKKGSTISFTISDGPDPEEVISLPDFKNLSQSQLEQWITENKAENLSLLTEYSDKVEKGKFVRVDISDKEITAEKYRRRDNANVYYSKGKEVFEKNISVPDFKGKTKNDVDDWASKNDVKIKVEENDSDKVEEGLILSQSVEKGKKVAKNDTMTIKISIGKAIIVPNFSNYTAESATNLSNGLEVNVKQVFADNVPYGQLISQSIESGTKLTGKDSKGVEVVYSSGRPYLKSYFGQLEGDIPKLIYDDFNSKGASLSFEVYAMDSDKEKGEIVKMSAYNQYIPLNAHVVFGISNGRFADAPTPKSSTAETE